MTGLGRRELLQVATAMAALAATRPGLAQTAFPRQDDLLRFDAVGQVTLLNFTDLHAQLVPIYFREPSANIGVGAARGLPPHLVGERLLATYNITRGSYDAYALACTDFEALGRTFGRMGGLDRMATLIKAIRAERPGKVLLLDGGDTWQGSYTALQNKGADMVRLMNALQVDAMTAHWEFTYGQDRVQELIKQLNFPFLAGNVKDATWGDPVFKPYTVFERGGVRIGVIGQAFPYTPIANPRYMIPDWSFGIEEEKLATHIAKLRDDGVDLVVLLSHNGFDVDRKLAGRVKGIDVILTGHTHDALPAPVKVGDTLLVAAGSHGKFLARLDLEIRDKRIQNYAFRLIPVLADVIDPDPDMAGLIREVRAPHSAALEKVVGYTESLLYRRGNFNGTFDDLICQALMAERDVEIALSPGFRWGATLLPEQEISGDDIFNQTAITYPAAYRTEMTGAALKEVMEDVADNLFNPDPYYQQGGDMVRAGGLSYTIDIGKPAGQRISDLTLLRTGEKIDVGKKYTVSGWASVNEGVEGPPVYDVVTKYVEAVKRVRLEPNRQVKVLGADPSGYEPR
ncbi:sulfate thiol esterase SoxB [Enhydrobacter aerosaccus]|uniref:Sulfate thiol esterase SoxB n=1 Tax=Enhydrobacter aerosaccus TaxID=225324 RepID=A0A1T4T107_9HYPH|nr:thiosulfohydrolase SoxB [Enhydrobacter aerosaccus]SKA33848.1 sulfate thiol esterase SoxB [Enhydrobacter aerosaccus]